MVGRMNILLIGSPDSIYIKQYIKNVLQPENAKIYLACNDSLDRETAEFYKNEKVVLSHIYQKSGALKKVPFIGTVVSFNKNIKRICKKENIDVIHIHYIGNKKLMKFSYKTLKKYSSKLILTFWGSDLFCLNKHTAKDLNGLLDASHKIVVPTESMRKKFHELYKRKYDQKIVSCLFGNPIVDKYIEMKNSDEEFGSINPFNIPKDKYVVSVGYNGSERQQHDSILLEMANLPCMIKENIFIIIQAGYGINNSSYIDLLENIMKDSKLNYLIIDRYIDEKETIWLKKRVDLFIHGQVSDALSSSVLEYMYFKTNTLNPTWIQYLEWKALGLKYFEYDDFSDLCQYIEAIYNGEVFVEHEKNAEIIEKNFSWRAHANEWKSLYM